MYFDDTLAGRSLLTVSQFSEKHPAFTQGSLRHLIFQAKPRESQRGKVSANGLDKALLRMGRRVFIDEQQFFEWLDRASRNDPRQLSFDFSGQ